MLFLIEYDRGSGKIVSFRSFADTQRRQVREDRLALELTLDSQGIKHEVAVLEAASEQALHKTHRRYFESLEGLAAST